MNHRDPTDAGAVIVVVVVALLLAMCTVSVWQSGHRDQHTQKGPLMSSQLVAGGYPIPSLALVAVDNESIFGSGSVQDPLRAASVVTRTIARPNPGQLLVIGDAIDVAGQKPTATTSVPHAAVLGLATAFPSIEEVTYQFTGVVTLTEAQWEGVTEDGSPLTPGNYYYLSAATAGKITDVPPAGPDYVVPIGIALASGLELQLQLGAPVVGA